MLINHYYSSSRINGSVRIHKFIELATGAVPLNQPSPLTEEQLRVIKTLPSTVMFSLMQMLEQTRDVQQRVRRLPSVSILMYLVL